MTRDDMTPAAYDHLINAIGELLFSQGLKATTMDSIAASLQISKRTLYEIFNSKNEMVLSALEAAHRQHMEEVKRIFDSASNIMEGVLKGFLYERDEMRRVNLDFFRDMDFLYVDARNHSSNNKKQMQEKFLAVFKKGARQGYFRKNVNFALQCRLLWIQMESLKRMEEFFPPDITLLEAYDSICIGFLRSISTEKGLEILERMTEHLEASA